MIAEAALERASIEYCYVEYGIMYVFFTSLWKKDLQMFLRNSSDNDITAKYSMDSKHVEDK